MIVGIGTDVCQISRIELTLVEHGQRFLERLLTHYERMESLNSAQLARRWAIKEATAKAYGTGIGGALGFQDIEVTHTEAGAPVVRVLKHPHDRVLASVSDDAGVACAFVLVERA